MPGRGQKLYRDTYSPNLQRINLTFFPRWTGTVFSWASVSSLRPNNHILPIYFPLPFPQTRRPDYNPNNDYTKSRYSSYPWSLAIPRALRKALDPQDLPYTHSIHGEREPCRSKCDSVNTTHLLSRVFEADFVDRHSTNMPHFAVERYRQGKNIEHNVPWGSILSSLHVVLYCLSRT